MPTISSALIEDRMGAVARVQREPMQVTLEIIATCNFACKHCYIAPGAERDDVMSLERAQQLFDSFAAAGTMSLLLTGGEVLTHRQFREIYRSAKQHGFLVYVNTNGYLIGERWADFFAESVPHTVSISLYGMSNERYEAVTGIPNAFRRVEHALDLLEARGINYTLKCPAFALTADEIPAMQAYAKARGVRFSWDAVITPHENGGLAPVRLQLAPREVQALGERLDPGGVNTLSYFTPRVKPHNGRVYSCGAGRQAMHVTVKGDVTTCTSSRHPVGNIFRDGFDHVWGKLGEKVSLRFRAGHPCEKCQFRSVCYSCPANVEAITNAPDGYVPHYCKMTHLRAHGVGLHPTGVPRTMLEGVPTHVQQPGAAVRRALPVLV
ncbi:MAG: radical SAM protein [Gemmatimonadaceae bacterium]